MGAPPEDHERLIATAEKANRELEGAPPLEVLRWAGEEFGDRICMTSSMGDAVLATLASKEIPGIDVIFLDTGYHFAETIGTRDAVAATLPIHVLNIKPARSVPEQDAEFGEKLYERDPDLCCRMRKVRPLETALATYHAWMSGIRRDEAESRRDTPVVAWDAKREMVKVNPMACWTQEDVDTFIADEGVLVNPLTYAGYPSIGCAPCTRAVAPGEDPRAGRWAGQNKTECGLHE